MLAPMARKTCRCGRRPRLQEGGTDAALPARRFGRMGESAHRRTAPLNFGGGMRRGEWASATPIHGL
jgi:hypothetical protein